MSGAIKTFRMRLPATSANLGPGFDAVAIAMALYLTVEARIAPAYSIEATGRDTPLCSDVSSSLILTTYRDLLGVNAPAIALTLNNEIPLGMGCGSSAAALLAGVALANHFGDLRWTRGQILAEACRREGHPDNVAACWEGWFTASAMRDAEVFTATCGQHLAWKLILAVPASSLATSKARALLPDSYSRADAVANVQSTALLVAAFALGRSDLLKTATGDRLHQPYRLEACPLLATLLPLAERGGVLGVALSGAGPSVLMIVDAEASEDLLFTRIRAAAGDPTVKLVRTEMCGGAE